MKLVAKVWKANIFNTKQNHSNQAATTKSKHRLHAQKSEGIFFPQTINKMTQISHKQ